MPNIVKINPDTGKAELESEISNKESHDLSLEAGGTDEPTAQDNHRRLMKVTQSLLVDVYNRIPTITCTSEAKDLAQCLSSVHKVVAPQSQGTNLDQNAHSIINQFFPNEPK